MPILNKQEREGFWYVFQKRFFLGEETVTIDEMSNLKIFERQHRDGQQRRVWGERLAKLILQRLEDNGALPQIDETTWKIETRSIEVAQEIENPDRLQEVMFLIRRHPFISWITIAAVGLMFLANLVNGTWELLSRFVL